MKLNRRTFINTILGLGGLTTTGSILYPIFSFLNPPKINEPKVSSIKAGNAAEFEINSAKIVKFGRKPLIVIRKEDGNFSALSATCTHLDCIVQYRKDTKQIICACHNGKYDLKGRNVSGPPPRPLEEYAVQIVNDEIVITTMEA